MTFEESIARLDEIVAALSAGQTSLEESLSLYEEGTRLLRTAGTQLKEAHVKLETLSKEEESL